MLMALGGDYVRTARAKGVSESGVTLRHALRNALLPVYTTVTLRVGQVLGGAVVVETVFSYPGLGRLIYEDVRARDYPLLQGTLLFVAVGVVAANLLADLGYPLIDPRVRRGGTPA
jgi:peptide/nickel transport system permease protein